MKLTLCTGLYNALSFNGAKFNMESQVEFKRAYNFTRFSFFNVKVCFSKIKNGSEVVIWKIQMRNQKQLDPTVYHDDSRLCMAICIPISLSLHSIDMSRCLAWHRAQWVQLLFEVAFFFQIWFHKISILGWWLACNSMKMELYHI